MRNAETRKKTAFGEQWGRLRCSVQTLQSARIEWPAGIDNADYNVDGIFEQSHRLVFDSRVDGYLQLRDGAELQVSPAILLLRYW
jgi:hypothetical protein